MTTEHLLTHRQRTFCTAAVQNNNRHTLTHVVAKVTRRMSHAFSLEGLGLPVQAKSMDEITAHVETDEEGR